MTTTENLRTRMLRVNLNLHHRLILPRTYKP